MSSAAQAGTFERIVEFVPAFDRRDPVPSKNYGIHGVDLRMVLKGDEGAVQFVLYTGWHLPEVVGSRNSDGGRYGLAAHEYSDALHAFNGGLHPMPADLGYHSPRPIYEHQPIVNEACEYVGGGPCYYGGSGLNAWRPFERLLREGSDGVWAELEDYYGSVFSDARLDAANNHDH